MHSDTRGGEPIFAESASVQRTAKARAHAAQYLLNDLDNGIMPLLPDDPAQRVSLHRQLRGRYNPTQIPLSSLSCSAYLGAGDVAELARLFRDFNLFSTEAINSLDAEALKEADDGTEPEQGTEGRGTARSRQSPALQRGGKRGSIAQRLAAATAQAAALEQEVDVTEGKSGMELIRFVARPPSSAPPPQSAGKAGVTATTAGAAVTAATTTTAATITTGAAASPRSTSPSRGAATAVGEGRASGSPSTSPVSPSKAEFPSTPGGGASKDGLPRARAAAAAAAARERRELAEPFTSEGSDSALTAGWLVELLMEMVAANFTETSGTAISGAGGGAGGGGAVSSGGLNATMSQGPPQKPSGASVPASRPGTGTRPQHGHSNIAMSASLANAPAAMMNSSVNMSYHNRRRDARIEQLRSFKVELITWVEQLAQLCDEREHPGAWQQCAMQSEVLQRYEACVLQNSAVLTLPPGTVAAGTAVPHMQNDSAGLMALSTRVKTMNSANLAQPSSSLMLKATAYGGASPRSGGMAGSTSSAASGTSTVAGGGVAAGRVNVSWGPTNGMSSVKPASVSPTPTARDGPSSRQGGAGMARDPSSSPIPLSTSAPPMQGRRRTEAAGGSREPAGASGPVFDVLPTAQTAGWYGKMDGSSTLSAAYTGQSTYDDMTPPIELLQSSASSLAASLVLPSTAPTSTVPLGLSSTNVSTAALNMVMGDRGAAAAAAAAVKARLSAPHLRHLLQNPQQLYAFLWTSVSAARLAEEEARDNHLFQHQRSRPARSPHLPPPGRSGGQHDRQPSSGNVSRTVSSIAGRRSRAAPQQHLVCWSDVASNLLMGLETTWLSQRHDAAYGRVPTALLDDPAELAAATKTGASGTAGGGHGAGNRSSDTGRGVGGGGGAGVVGDLGGGGGVDDDSDSGDDGLGEVPSGAGVGGNGQARRRRLHKDGTTADVVALQQRATLLSSLGSAAENALGSLHAQSADHIVAAPSQRYTVTSSKDGLLKVWDTARGQFVSTILNVGQAWVLALTFLHGGEFLMVATSSAEITVVNFPGGGVVLKLRGCTSLATAVQQVKQPSTIFTKRYGLKPGECGRHKPIRSDGGGWLGAAAAAARLMEYNEGESEPIVARPIVGYVTPTAAFYDTEIGFLFFGTMSGMVGCIDLSTVFSRTALHAAAAGAGWSYPLQVYAAVLAHATVPAGSRKRSQAGGLSMGPTALSQLSAESETNPLAIGAPGTLTTATTNSSTPRGHRGTRMGSSIATPAAAAIVASCNGTAINGVVGQQIRHVLFCGVGHCLITADADGGIMRTPFAAAADTLDYALGTPTPVVTTAKAIRFLVSCLGGRRFITVHSDRHAILWAVGRTVTECVHQYPQQAYDIVDICFMQPHQQVAMLMADHSIHIFDERGSRPLATIQPPRGLSSRVEDMASITLKLSANDVDGCLAYLRTSQRLVCGLRGPVLYEPATRSAPPTGGASVSVADTGDVVAHSDAPTDAARRSGLGGDGPGAGAAVAVTLLPPGPPSTSGGGSLHRAETRSASSQDSSMESSLVLLPAAQPVPHHNHLSFYGPATGAAILGRPGPILAAARPATQAPSFYNSVGSSAFNLDMEGSRADAERARVVAMAAQEEARRQRLINTALRKAHLRLRPNQTHATAVIGILVDPARHELHTFSTDTWCVWDYQTGERLRHPLHVPRAAEHELAVRGRRVLLTCCSWSTEIRSRVLVGTRDSRVLTLDAQVGSVVSSTDPFTQIGRGLASGSPSPLLLADKDVSAIATAGSRTLMCSGRVCEVRRYEVTSAPHPSGEERFVSMRVELPMTAHAGLGSAGAGSAAATAIAGAPGTATVAGGGSAPGGSGSGTVSAAGATSVNAGMSAAAMSSGASATAPASPGAGGTVANPSAATTHPASAAAALIAGGVDTTITACCVVRESHLCLGTADTQLFFYRMVDRSTPVQREFLSDAHGVPDVGRVVKLHYLSDPTQDVLLAIVDTGLLYIYSYTMQRMLGRYTFPPLGVNTTSVVPSVMNPRNHVHTVRQQEHYITSIAFTEPGTDASPLSALTMACGDSGGYVHVIILGSLVAEAVNGASRDTSSAAAHATRSHELHASAAFRASRGGVSALGLVTTNLAWTPEANTARSPAASSGFRSVSPSSTGSRAVVSLVDTGSVHSTAAGSPSSMQVVEPHLLVFASGYDGNVRAFGLVPRERPQQLASPRFPPSALASTGTGVGWSPGMTQLPFLQSGIMGATALSGTGVSHATGGGIRGSFFRSLGTTSAVGTAAGLGGLQATTIGLCGVDRWNISEPATFSDVEQASTAAQMHSDAHVDVVLPSILTEGDLESPARGTTTRLLGAGGVGADATPDRSRGSPTTATPTPPSVVGVTYTNGKESGVVLLYEILRSSKKALGTVLPTGTVSGVGLPAQTPPPQRAAATTGLTATTSGGAGGAATAVAAGGTLRGHTSMARSRRTPSPGPRPGSARSATGAGHRRPDSARGDEASGGAGFSGCPGAIIYAAPPPSPPPAPLPTSFTLHSIAELVRDTRPSSWSRSTHLHLGSHADGDDDDAAMGTGTLADLHEAGLWAEVMMPVPFPQAKQNPLVRVYPVALLRRMGLLHPLDTTPDVDVATGLPVLISAAEAFKPWEARLGSQPKPGTALSPTPAAASTPTAILFAAASAGSKQQHQPPSMGGHEHTPMVVVVPIGLTSTPDGEDETSAAAAAAAGPPRVGFESLIQHVLPPSSSDVSLSLSGMDASAVPNPRRMTAAAPAILAARAEPTTERPVFLTEAGVDWARPGATEGPPDADEAASATAAAVTEDGSADLSVPRDTSTEPNSEGADVQSEDDVMQRVVICSPLNVTPTFTDGASDSVEGYHVPMRRSVVSINAAGSAAASVTSPVSMARGATSSTTTGPGGAASARPRPVLVTATLPTTQAQTQTMKKLAFLRTTLESVDPVVLRLREEQMMLAHMAGQLDRSRRTPPLLTTTPSPPPGSTSATAAAAAAAVAAATSDSHVSDGSVGPVAAHLTGRPSSQSRGSHPLGEHTAKLLGLWRHRAGDTAVSSIVKALGFITSDPSPEPRAAVAAAAAGDAAASEHTAAAEHTSETEGRLAKGRGVGCASSRSSARGSVLGHGSLSRSVRGVGSTAMSRAPSSVRLQRQHDTKGSALSAYVSQLHARPAAAFGLEFLTLVLPNEPQAPAAPVRGARTREPSTAAVPPTTAPRRGPRLGASRTAGLVRPETTLPMIAVQQELQPIQVRLPSTLRTDEAERMSLRRFDAAFNQADTHGSTRRMAYLLPSSAAASSLYEAGRDANGADTDAAAAAAGPISAILHGVRTLLHGVPSAAAARVGSDDSGSATAASRRADTSVSTRGAASGLAKTDGASRHGNAALRALGSVLARSPPPCTSGNNTTATTTTTNTTTTTTASTSRTTDADLYEGAVDYSDVEEILRCPLPPVPGCPTPYAFGHPGAHAATRTNSSGGFASSDSCLPAALPPSSSEPHATPSPPLIFRCIGADTDTGIAVFSTPVEECPMHLMRAYTVLPCAAADVLQYMDNDTRPRWDTHIRRSALLRELTAPAVLAAHTAQYRLSSSLDTARTAAQKRSPTSLSAQHRVASSTRGGTATSSSSAQPASSRARPFRHERGQRRVAIHYLETRSPVPFVQDRDFEVVVAEEIREDGSAYTKAFSTPLGYHMPLDPQQSRYVRAVVLLSGIVARPLDTRRAAQEGALPPLLLRDMEERTAAADVAKASRNNKSKPSATPSLLLPLPSAPPVREYCVVEYVGLVHPMGMLPAVLVNMVISAQLDAMRKLQAFVLRHPISTLRLGGGGGSGVGGGTVETHVDAASPSASEAAAPPLSELSATLQSTREDRAEAATPAAARTPSPSHSTPSLGLSWWRRQAQRLRSRL